MSSEFISLGVFADKDDVTFIFDGPRDAIKLILDKYINKGFSFLSFPIIEWARLSHGWRIPFHPVSDLYDGISIKSASNLTMEEIQTKLLPYIDMGKLDEDHAPSSQVHLLGEIVGYVDYLGFPRLLILGCTKKLLDEVRLYGDLFDKITLLLDHHIPFQPLNRHQYAVPVKTLNISFDSSIAGGLVSNYFHCQNSGLIIETEEEEDSPIAAVSAVSAIAKRFLPLLKGGSSDEDILRICGLINEAHKLDQELPAHLATSEDILQDPLQPLSVNLRSSIYSTFEADIIKYVKYTEAIGAALKDFKGRELQKPDVMIVGAGRGPLVDCLLSASNKHDCELGIVYVVEKNPYSFITLVERNQLDWNNQVRLILSDARTMIGIKADVIISELLGSFGDNELAPEILYPCEGFLRDVDSIMIPHDYTSHIQPVFCNVASVTDLIKSEAGWQRPFVLWTNKYFPLADAKNVLTFSHHWRKDSLSMPIPDSHCVGITWDDIQSPVPPINGFMGYFTCHLYKDITLSTHPSHRTTGLYSWYPMFFPLKLSGEFTGSPQKITLTFWRNNRHRKMWYEWQTTVTCSTGQPIKSPVVNSEGAYSFYSLSS